MRKLKLVALIALTAVVCACAASAEGPPPIQVDRTACAHCTMLISEPQYAAAYRVAGADARVFDDIACLLTALGTESREPAAVWFQDAGNGGWIEQAKATFVVGHGIRTPMSGGITAYKDRKSAEDAAARHSGTVVASWAELRTARGGR